MVEDSGNKGKRGKVLLFANIKCKKWKKRWKEKLILRFPGREY